MLQEYVNACAACLPECRRNSEANGRLQRMVTEIGLLMGCKAFGQPRVRTSLTFEGQTLHVRSKPWSRLALPILFTFMHTQVESWGTPGLKATVADNLLC